MKSIVYRAYKLQIYSPSSSANMQFENAIVVLLSALGSVRGASASDLGWKIGWKPAPSIRTDFLAAQGLVRLAEDVVFGHGHTNCSLTNAAKRKEW